MLVVEGANVAYSCDSAELNVSGEVPALGTNYALSVELKSVRVWGQIS